MTPDDGLDGWIADLRARLDRGELAGLKAIDLGHGTALLPGEATVRIMLADLRDIDDADGSASRDSAWRQERRHYLLGDFWRLRRLLG